MILALRVSSAVWISSEVLVGTAVKSYYITHNILLIFGISLASQGAGTASNRLRTMTRRWIIENVHCAQVTHNKVAGAGGQVL